MLSVACNNVKFDRVNARWVSKYFFKQKNCDNSSGDFWLYQIPKKRK